MEHLFIINPKSFRNPSEIKDLEDEICKCIPAGDSFYIHISRYPRDAVGIVNKFSTRCKDGIRIYAIGGDGILFDCLNGMVDYPAAELAAVPYGSTNDFARAICGGSLSNLMSIRRLLTAPSVPTDIIHCGSNYYLNFCSVGVEAWSINSWYKLQTKFLNTKNMKIINLITSISGIGAVFNKNLKNQHYNVTIDGKEYNGRYVSISFSNGPYCGGSRSIVPKAIFNDGYIDVLLVKSENPFRLLKSMPSYLTGGYEKFPDFVKHISAQEISISSELPMYANLDGEYFLDTNLTLKIMPSAVRIIAAEGLSYLNEVG